MDVHQRVNPTIWHDAPPSIAGERTECPRYFFDNESAYILGICGDALDRLECARRFNRRDSISVARAEAVTILDAHVGPKT